MRKKENWNFARPKSVYSFDRSLNEGDIIKINLSYFIVFVLSGMKNFSNSHIVISCGCESDFFHLANYRLLFGLGAVIGFKRLLATRLRTLVSGQQRTKAFVTKTFLVPGFFEATNRPFWRDIQPLRSFPMVIHVAK